MKEQVYDAILHRIIELKYLPGKKISENELGEDLQVGRTPIREAILQLRQEGLVKAIPQSGTYVSKINLSAAKDARYVRESLEVRVVGEAMEKFTKYDYTMLRQIIERQVLAESDKQKNLEFFKQDEAFHHYFYTATGHEQIWTWLQNVNMQLNRFRFLRLKNKNLTWDSLVKEHTDLVAAIEAGNTEQAQKKISEHLHRMLEEEPALRKWYPEYFEDN